MKNFFLAFMLLSNITIAASTIRSFHEIPKEYAGQSDESLLQEIINTTEKPVILKFYADWCAPCRRMIPILNEVAELFKDRILIININADIYTNLCNHFGIRYLPSLIYFKNGKEVQRTNSINQKALIDLLSTS